MNEKKKKIYTIALQALALLIFIGISYQNGYRITPQFRIVKTGILKINTEVKNPIIFVNREKREYKKALDGSYLIEKIRPGKTQIIISATSHWPWSKNIIINEGRITEVRPMLTPQNTIKRIIVKKSPDFKKIYNLLLTENLPSKTNRLKSPTGNIELWADGKTIKVAWIGKGAPTYHFCFKIITSQNKDCQKEVSVITLKDNPKYLAFNVGGEESILFAVNNSAYGIDIHKLGIQNIHPIYTGISPIIGIIDNVLYILDGEVIAEITT